MTQRGAPARQNMRPAQKRKRRRPPLLGWLFGVLAVAALVAVVGGATLLYARAELDPVSSTSDGDVIVNVHAGETLSDLAATLAKDNLIKSAFWFEQYAKFKGLAPKLRTGQYTLNDSMSAADICNRLSQPPDRQIATVTIPEGYTAKQMAQVFHDKAQVDIGDYLKEETTGTFTEPFLKDVPKGFPLEGFLFPDTYDIPIGASGHEVIQEQLDAFKAKAWPVISASSLPQGQNIYQVVTIASMIEKEVRHDADRAKVASVIYNRLKAGMPLQIDSTVIYGLDKVGLGQALTTADLQKDTPWNTYLHPGLPPTPIANPGVASVTAAMQPASTKYLYYVSDCSGNLYYSVDLATHQQQVQQYASKPC